MSTGVNTKRVSIQDFAAGLRKFPESEFNSTDQVINFLKSAPVDPDTLSPYLHWDRQHYTRNLIDKTALYELLSLIHISEPTRPY